MVLQLKHLVELRPGHPHPEREETDVETALRHARAVFFALGDALSPEAVAHLAASLPQTFDPLVAEAQRRDLDIMPADQFWARVRQRLGVDDTTAAGPKRVGI